MSSVDPPMKGRKSFFEKVDRHMSDRRGGMPPGMGPALDSQQPLRANITESHPLGETKEVRIEGTDQLVDAYNGVASTLATGTKVLIVWTAGNEASTADPPQRGQWEIVFRLDPEDGVGPTAGKCACSKCTRFLTSQHSCTKCCKIAKTRYFQPPPIYKLVEGEASVEWEEAGLFQVLTYIAGCVWRSVSFDGPGCDNEYGLKDTYRWELDLSGCKRADGTSCPGILRLVRISGENCEELYLEFCLTPKCDFQCGCPWTFRRSDFDGIDITKFDGQCDYCVTATIDIPIPPCWDCPQDPPEYYEIDVPAEAYYKWTDPESPYATSDVPNRLAGQTIRLKRVSACDGQSSFGNWSVDKYNCPGTHDKAVAVEGFATSTFMPCGGECNLYYFEDDTTYVWLFVSAMPANEVQASYVESSVTFVDKRSTEYPSLISGRGGMVGYYYLLEWEDELPWSGGQQSENWCEETELQLRCGWFNTFRRYIADTQHWYATATDRDAETGYTVTQGDIDEERLFGVEDDESGLEPITSWWKATGTAGSVTWVYYTDPFYSEPYICNSNTSTTKGEADSIGTLIVRVAEGDDPPKSSGNKNTSDCGSEDEEEIGDPDPDPELCGDGAQAAYLKEAGGGGVRVIYMGCQNSLCDPEAYCGVDPAAYLDFALNAPDYAILLEECVCGGAGGYPPTGPVALYRGDGAGGWIEWFISPDCTPTPPVGASLGEDHFASGSCA